MPIADRAVLAALAFDGLVVGVLCVAFLNIYSGSVPVPVTAVVGGVLVAWFVRIATTITAGSVRYAPLIAWLVPVCAGLLGGPGGDVLLYADWRTLLLVVVGVGAPVITSWVWRGPGMAGPPSSR
ncbi:facilitated glucose transporter [Williamsia deligens]|uniref:Facilitated glucose transporter n=1 Tax=Williamsia deligens TaxID=321325 RepID=A0ABW3G0S4_9NOCA|nr:facilitated glucose transporter [Williamsia deligens]